MTDEGKAAAELAIDRIKASGGTNLSGGLFKGIDQHQQAAGQGAPSSSSNGDSGRCKHASSCCCLIHASLPYLIAQCIERLHLTYSCIAIAIEPLRAITTCLRDTCWSIQAEGFRNICVPCLPTNTDLLKMVV